MSNEPVRSGRQARAGVHCAIVVLGWIVLSWSSPAQAWPGGGLGTQFGVEETWGVKAQWKEQHYMENGVLRCDLIASSHVANILAPGDKTLKLTLQFCNLTEQPIKAKGKIVVVRYGLETRSLGGHEIFRQTMVKLSDAAGPAVELDVPASRNIADRRNEERGSQVVEVQVPIGAEMGGYALLVDIEGQDRLFAAGATRCLKPAASQNPLPRFSLDGADPAVLARLGVRAVRHQINYPATTNPKFDELMAKERSTLQEFHKHGITVLLMVQQDVPKELHPLPILLRPFLEDGTDRLKGRGPFIYPGDGAWPPSLDADFAKWMEALCVEFGWPKGPVTGVHLWNEPWEGASIAGWQADMLRYREMYKAMAEGVHAARKQGAQVLVGGCDSGSNALDKLFGDGKDDFLPIFDFVSTHYCQLSQPSLIKKWRERKQGRVLVWDTESWIANSEDRVPVAYLGETAAGCDRVLGVQQGNIVHSQQVKLQGKWIEEGEGNKKRRLLGKVNVLHSFSVATAVAAGTGLIGDREWKGMLFEEGLPYVGVFADGNQPDDGTLVVVGDLGTVFSWEAVPFRTVLGNDDAQRRTEMKAQAEDFRKRAKETQDATKQWELTREADSLDQQLQGRLPIRTGAMVIDDSQGEFQLLDCVGNAIPARDGKLTVPIADKGFYLRSSGKAGSFERLFAAVKAAKISGFYPVELKARDLLARIDRNPELRIEARNILNRPITGTLVALLEGLTLEPASQQVALQPGEMKTFRFRVAGGAVKPSNTYRCSAAFDGGPAGQARLEEDLHVNVIARFTTTVDGKLDDWARSLPHTIFQGAGREASFTEEMWLPMKQFGEQQATGVATGMLAWDENNFYFAAKIADSTPDDGLRRFETLDANEFFYPQVAYLVDHLKTFKRRDFRWEKKEVADYAVRLPDGNVSPVAWWPEVGNQYAFDLELPQDRPTQVTFYVYDAWGDAKGNGSIDVWPLDANGEVGKARLCGQSFPELKKGAFLVTELSGKARAIVRFNNWRGAPLGGIFLDEPASGAKPDQDKKTQAWKPYGKVLRTEEDSPGQWKDRFGKLGWMVAGGGEKQDGASKIKPYEALVQQEMRWPDGVRRYTYRKDPELPSGNQPRHDNVQIAFNVIPAGEDDWLAKLPGTPMGLTAYKCTDYEYALNKVVPKYGGGYEVWRLLAPGMPRKHFYPRQPASPLDGAVKDARMAVVHSGNTRVVEAAIPWSEIPLVRKKLDAGEPVKFSFMVNDNKGGSYDLAFGRSVFKGGYSFHVDWMRHWTNEVEFSFEK